MKAVTAVIGFASALVLLYLGAEVMRNTIDIWAQVKAAPAQFVHFISNSLSHNMFWTAIVLVGVFAAILYVRGVPAAKVR
jgi:hypothetical protein